MDQHDSIPELVQYHGTEKTLPKTSSDSTSSLESGNTKEASLPQTDSKDVLTDWDGPDDLGNPKNWSFGARLYGTFVPAYYSFAV